jgi:hypothetical protein
VPMQGLGEGQVGSCRPGALRGCPAPALVAPRCAGREGPGSLVSWLSPFRRCRITSGRLGLALARAGCTRVLSPAP